MIAFSPTDTMPLTRRAKAMMALHSLVAISALAVVVTRAINILKYWRLQQIPITESFVRRPIYPAAT